MASAPFDPDLLVEKLQAVAQPSRFAVLRLLARHEPFGLGAGDIARLIAVPHNTLSTHLAQLESAGLVRSRKDGRRIVYAIDRAATGSMLAELGKCLAPVDVQGQSMTVPALRERADGGPRYSVLVLCTHNSARSIMAEALINHEGRGRIRAYSAGSQPRGIVDPEAIRLLGSLGYDTTGLHSKTWQVFAEAGAPGMDFVITVCDTAAGEKCPNWPGHPLVAHWGIADPLEAGTSEAERREAFRNAYRQLSARVAAFVNLPIEEMSPERLRSELALIGRLEGATATAMAGKTGGLLPATEM
ncbi:metalloregulator ArsR/SmtB family transcription factor [Rhabdaerophilum sp. SD176]|uniref:metalloregulator ArsR/SmtB family transcription factor n=1 Tax=Rhabdaerophilum sp. SD176 TaxID=2983548 RepID=UPI0024DFE8C1|nr:metalloregulator ArsR/SmtB family transcription factor [Rhabdaerophilum sp. SD176]